MKIRAYRMRFRARRRPWGDCREWLARWHHDSTSSVRNGITMRVRGRMSKQRFHAFHKLVRNGMLDLFRLSINLVQGEAHDLHQKEFKQAMAAEKVTSFPAQVQLGNVARFEYFRKGDRPAGVWLVRRVSADRFYAIILAMTFLIGVKLTYDAVLALA